MWRDSYLYRLYYNMVVYVPRQICFYYNRFWNVQYRNKYQFSAIKKYKDIYKGQRAFVVATGPSLTVEDINLIRGEISFGVNSIVLIYDKTDWRPTYYGIQDKNAYERLEDQIISSRNEIEDIFCGVSIKNLTPEVRCSCTYYALNILDHDRWGLKHIQKCTTKADLYLYSGHSITFSMMELAMYMGFSEIVLLGVDCDYSGSKAHFQEYTSDRVQNASYHMYQSYISMKKYADARGVHIINASRGGKLDVFDRVQLEDYMSRYITN